MRYAARLAYWNIKNKFGYENCQQTTSKIDFYLVKTYFISQISMTTRIGICNLQIKWSERKQEYLYTVDPRYLDFGYLE